MSESIKKEESGSGIHGLWYRKFKCVACETVVTTCIASSKVPDCPICNRLMEIVFPGTKEAPRFHIGQPHIDQFEDTPEFKSLEKQYTDAILSARRHAQQNDELAARVLKAEAEVHRLQREIEGHSCQSCNGISFRDRAAIEIAAATTVSILFDMPGGQISEAQAAANRNIIAEMAFLIADSLEQRRVSR